MVVPRRAGYIFLALGIVLCSLTFAFSGGTERACPEIDSFAYDTFGIYLSEFRITEVDISSLELGWYDGCNWRWGPLLFLILGMVSAIAGLVIARKPAKDLSNSTD